MPWTLNEWTWLEERLLRLSRYLMSPRVAAVSGNRIFPLDIQCCTAGMGCTSEWRMDLWLHGFCQALLEWLQA